MPAYFDNGWVAQAVATAPCHRLATRRLTSAARGPTRRSWTWCSTTTGFIGTPEQIAERVAAYRKRAVELIRYRQEEVEPFDSLVRENEESERDSSGSPVSVSA